MNEKINKLVEETLNSMDTHEKAMPASFLLTRINARINNGGVITLWDKITGFITKPVVAFSVLFVIVSINLVIIKFNTSNTIESYLELSENQEFNPITTAIYDIENITP